MQCNCCSSISIARPSRGPTKRSRRKCSKRYDDDDDPYRLSCARAISKNAFSTPSSAPQCEDLQAFCIFNRPKKAWNAPTATAAIKSAPSPVTAARRVQSQKSSVPRTSVFDLKKAQTSFSPYPKHHYLALSLPPPWERPSREMPTDEKLRHRASVVNELLATETAYVRDLGILIGVRLEVVREWRACACTDAIERLRTTL